MALKEGGEIIFLATAKANPKRWPPWPRPLKSPSTNEEGEEQNPEKISITINEEFLTKHSMVGNCPSYNIIHIHSA